MKEELEIRLKELDKQASNVFDEKFNYISYRIKREKILELLALFED